MQSKTTYFEIESQRFSQTAQNRHLKEALKSLCCDLTLRGFYKEEEWCKNIRFLKNASNVDVVTNKVISIGSVVH